MNLITEKYNFYFQWSQLPHFILTAIYLILFYLHLHLYSFGIYLLPPERLNGLKALVTVGVFSGLLLIPFDFFTLMQMSDPYYLETFRRLGLVYTHIPAIEAFFF